MKSEGYVWFADHFDNINMSVNILIIILVIKT
jgi:hypothetical protein